MAFSFVSPPTRRDLLLLRLHAPAPTATRRRWAASASLNGLVKGSGRLRIAYQGAPGAYSEVAAKTACPECTMVPCRAFEDVVKAVEMGRADRAVIPVGNTMEGTAVRNYDLLLMHDLQIVQEINLFTHYCLLAMPGVGKGELKRVISHPMALTHCGRSLTQLGLDREPVDDTAGAVELLLSHRMLDTAAIASSRAALMYGLDVLAHGFQDEPWNVTRFLIFSKNPDPAPKSQFGLKTSMVVGHHGGTLRLVLKVLSAFSSRNMNLTKLEIHIPKKEDGPVMILDVGVNGPTVEEFPHVLYVDFEGSMHEENADAALAEISKLPVFIRILGCFAADPKVYNLK